jgi:hypothetical protein
VILNLIRSRARGDGRKRAREDVCGSPEPVPTAEEMLAERQTERLLAQMVLALEEPYRRTILLRFHDGQSSAAIARADGVPEGTVRWRLKYGLDELRRRFAERKDGGQKALGALIPIAGLPAAPAPVAIVSTWLVRAALGQGKAVLTAAGALAGLAAVASGVAHRPHEARSPAAAPGMVARAGARRAPSVFPLPGAPLMRDGLDLPQTNGAQASATTVPPAVPLTLITGIVRDSRGEPAARVPVTLRRLVGSGTADRITTTDGAGQFRYLLRSRGSFVLTAELQGEPAARTQIQVPNNVASRFDAGPSLKARAASFATIDVAFDSPGRWTAARTVRKPRPTPAGRLSAELVDPFNPTREPGGLGDVSSGAASTSSRWCCHHAFADGGVVYGRACLKFEDNTRSEQSGCELFGLKRQVSCRHRIHGGLSTGDLSRTERLDCDGRLL